MKEDVFERDGLVYIEYIAHEYPLPDYIKIIKLPKEKINYVEQLVGPKGGDHGWKILSKDPYPYNGIDGKEFDCLKEFGRGRIELMNLFISKVGCPLKEVLYN
jgi:hypothetical protein